MDSISLFLEKDVLPEEKSEANKIRRKALVSGSPRIKNYINAFSLLLTCFVCTLKHQNHFWRSYMKGFVEVIQEEDPCLTELLPKDIGGQTCKKRRRSMSRNAINVREIGRAHV